MSANEKIEYKGKVWLIDNNNPKPLLNHSVEKLIEYGVTKDAITITDAPTNINVGEIVVKIWPHHLEVGRVRTIRNESFISGMVMNIDLKMDETGAYV
ncbi:MAG: hypothetical protein K8823_1205 [Cenarchaeum symbiont of Oopsacas minuta]|nr:hypothetical protein [Cenarchaeum symbiont of Oopsacas minuta]